VKVYPVWARVFASSAKWLGPRMLEYEGNNTVTVLLPQFRGHEGVKIECDVVLIIGNPD